MPNEHYDYKLPGFYFVTICTYQREWMFGSVRGGRMIMNQRAKIAEAAWKRLPELFPYVRLDEYVFMPNHMHGILEYLDTEEYDIDCRLPLEKIVKIFKRSASTHIRQKTGWFGWQRGSWRSYIRDERDLAIKCEYVRSNPAKWQQDTLYKTTLPGRFTPRLPKE